MLNLGVVYKDGRIINHRSLFKVALNPIFRYFGFQFGTLYDTLKNEIYGFPIMMQVEPKTKIEWKPYDMSGCFLEKRRRFV